MAGWRLRCTDDANTLLLLGTEVNGSCQRVDGNATYNQCLLAYLLDGKHRALVVSNAAGATVARAVVRLMLRPPPAAPRGRPGPPDPAADDPAAPPPVLLVEKVYYAHVHFGLHPVLHRALLRFACWVGEQLGGLEVVAAAVPADVLAPAGCVDRPFMETLASLGSPVPYEYVDSFGGRQRNPYSIPPGILFGLALKA